MGWFGLNYSVVFTSKPVPTSYSVTEKVLLLLPGDTLVPVQSSEPNSGTLIQRTRKALTLAKPSACTGNEVRCVFLTAVVPPAIGTARFAQPAKTPLQ